MIIGHYCWPFWRLVILLYITPPVIAVVSKKVLHLGIGWTLALMVLAMVAIVVVQILIDWRKTRQASGAGTRSEMNREGPPTSRPKVSPSTALQANLQRRRSADHL